MMRCCECLGTAVDGLKVVDAKYTLMNTTVSTSE